jgi:glycosyltransferase involved in cell wall biosynthesis
MSTIALCIPAYNAAWCLPRLLNSAKQQQISFDEILVYNDCSTDETSAIARAYGATVIDGDMNIGCSSGKNKLAAIAKSDWLHFHDADDDLLPNFTTVAHKWIQKEDSPDIVLLNYKQIDFLSGKLLGELDYDVKKLKSDTIKFCIDNKIVNFALIKKNPFLQIQGFDEDSSILFIEDRAFYIKAAISRLTFGYEPAVTCLNYYYLGSMSTANKARWPAAGYHLWVKVNESVGTRYPNEICSQLFQNAIWAGKANGWDTVKKSLALANKINPDFSPPGSRLFLKAFKVSPFYSFCLREMILRYFS